MSDLSSQTNNSESNQTLPPQASKHHDYKSPKILLLLFVLGITLLNGYFYWENMNLKKQLAKSSKQILPKTCEYGAVTYQPGESVPSIDDCNSCACDESGQVACTSMVCKRNNLAQALNTTNWQTFTSTEYRFSFKHPSDWEMNCPQISGEDWKSKTLCDFRAPNTTLDHGFLIRGANLAIGVEKPNQNSENLTERIETAVSYFKYKSLPQSVNNINGFLLTSSTGDPAFVFESQGRYITVNWVKTDTDSPYISYFEQILSTFEFVE